MKVYELVVEPGRAEHIAQHHVSVAEVEEVIFDSPILYRTRQNRYRLIGRTLGGRHLTIIVAPRGPGIYGLVTARDADRSERKLYEYRRR